jgi:O-antigen/teichoic acid export membrane protein
MGKGSGTERLNIVFSTSLSIQIFLSLIILILTESIGVWYINNVMVLPADRLVAANWCFQLSIFSFCLNLVTVPYRASIVAHERMQAFAYVSIIEGSAKLIIAFVIIYNPFDRLVYYALLSFLLSNIIRLIYQTYCRRTFEECKYKFMLDKEMLKNMFGYSVWQFVGNTSAILKTQGVNILLNLYFGPVVNAARGVANQVNNAIHNFAGNFMMALNPQITQSYSAGNLKYSFSLVNRGARFSYYILFILSLPVIINANYIMHLWLTKVPDYSVTFVQLILIEMMITSISRTLITLQSATGNIRNYQLIVGGILLLNLPLCYVMLELGFSPVIVVFVSLFVEALAILARMYMIPFTIPEFKPWSYVRSVLLNILIVSIIASVLPVALHILTEENLLNVLLNIVFAICTSTLCVFYIGCSKHERTKILEAVGKLKAKILRK